MAKPRPKRHADPGKPTRSALLARIAGLPDGIKATELHPLGPWDPDEWRLRVHTTLVRRAVERDPAASCWWNECPVHGEAMLEAIRSSWGSNLEPEGGS